MSARRFLPVFVIPAFVLAACSSGDLVAPEITAQASASAPNLDSARVGRILDSIQDTLNTADSSRDPALLQARLEGGARTNTPQRKPQILRSPNSS